MKAPVLVVGPRAIARSVAAVLQAEFMVTIDDDVDRAHALVSIGAHLAVIAVGGVEFAGAVQITGPMEPAAILSEVKAAVTRGATALHEQARNDHVGTLHYEHFLELVRYAVTRRYLASLLERHRGSVTDAARGAGLKRESLHRLLRRHHMMAEDYRDR